MFLFAKVVLDNLGEQSSPADLRVELGPDVFPHGLEEAYATEEKSMSDQLLTLVQIQKDFRPNLRAGSSDTSTRRSTASLLDRVLC